MDAKFKKKMYISEDIKLLIWIIDKNIIKKSTLKYFLKKEEGLSRQKFPHVLHATKIQALPNK